MLYYMTVYIVLATGETTVTQQVSHRPIKCQSRLWSQRGTKVNGSHHADNPLLRPTGIQIATKSYAALQAMAPTNIKTVHQTSLLHIESNLDRLGMLPPKLTHRDAPCACIPHSFISLDCCLLLSICVFISLCVASVSLALVFMPGLYPTAYRATFPAFLCGWL